MNRLFPCPCLRGGEESSNFREFFKLVLFLGGKRRSSSVVEKEGDGRNLFIIIKAKGEQQWREENMEEEV